MYFNTISQLASSVSGSASFTTAYVIENHDGGAVQVNWASFASTGAFFTLKGSADGGNNYNTLINNASVSMTASITASFGAQVFDIEYFGGTHIQVYYSANGTTGAGSLNIFRVMKGRR